MSKDLQVMNGQNKLALWAERVSACRNSGLGVKAWCRENGVNEQTYYKWQKKLFTIAQSMLAIILANNIFAFIAWSKRPKKRKRRNQEKTEPFSPETKKNFGIQDEYRSYLMAEKEGFEPSIPFWGIHDFQSCALGQLRDFSMKLFTAQLGYNTTSTKKSQALFFLFSKNFFRAPKPPLSGQCTRRGTFWHSFGWYAARSCLPLWGRCLSAHTGAERVPRDVRTPSQSRLRRASSPRGGAKRIPLQHNKLHSITRFYKRQRLRAGG